MGARWNYGTAGATGGGFSRWQVFLQPSFAEGTAERHWSWQRRSPKTMRDPNAWASRWPTARASFGGGGAGPGTDACCIAARPMFEPYSRDGDGCQGIKFVKGKVVDASDVAVSGATVRAFVSSTGAFAGEAVSKDDGTYEAPTQNVGVNHFVTAYKVGAPDVAGTTVNTLVPTNLDGT